MVAFAVGRDAGTPTVSPDRLEDVPLLMADIDAFPSVDNFAWRAFVALNWPSLTDAAHRGLPDRRKKLADAGPRVWETYKARYEVFPVGADGSPSPPQPWAAYAAASPWGGKGSGREKTLASFEAFMDFNQFHSPGLPGNPLVAQNRTYTRYETRLNKIEYQAFARSGWSGGRNLPGQEHPAQLPAGSIAVKAAWRMLTEADPPSVRARYYIVKDANVADVAGTLAAGRVTCAKSDIALVGLHIVIRTKTRPQGIWATFEHVDNVPPARAGEPDARDAGVPYSYFDASRPELGLWPELGAPGTLPVSLENPPALDPEPMQVVRRHPIHDSTMAMNRCYWRLQGIKGTVWENYMLVAAQWPTRARPVDPYNDGVFFPDNRRENLVSTVLETYVQDSPSSCMSCHQRFNVRGRDFIGILGSFR